MPCWYFDFVDFGKILLLAHACRPRSKRLGAVLFLRAFFVSQIVIALCWYLDLIVLA